MPHRVRDTRLPLRQDAAILHRKCLKIADDFAAKSADNALKFRTRRGTAGLPIQE
jgi:hypothetical protein